MIFGNPITQETSITELAGIISQALTDAGITAVLSGGAAVAVYTRNRYQSHDLDFVTSESPKKLEPVLDSLGFKRAEDQRSFKHPDTDYYVEFPPGPLTVGDTVVVEWGKLETKYGIVQILTPAQMVMDRLAAYFHWNDLQSRDQAQWIAEEHEVDWDELDNWAENENEPDKYEIFLTQLNRAP